MPDAAAETLPPGWSLRLLEELLEPKGLSYGIVQPGSHDPAGVPIVRVKDLRGGTVNPSSPLKVAPGIAASFERTKLKGGEVLISLVGSVGEVAVAPPELDGWNVARAVGVMRAGTEVSPAWIALALQTDRARHHILSHLNTTVQATLNLSDLREVPMVLPPRCERDAIAAVLGALDEKIAVNERIAATVDDLCAALFQEAVEQGDATEVELGRVGSVNAASVKPREDGHLRYIDIASVGVGTVQWPELSPWSTAPGRARRGVRSGDTIWSTVRPNRRSHALILESAPELVASTGLAVLTPTHVGAAYLYECTRREPFVQYLESVAEGSAYPAVRAEKFGKAIIPLLPHAELDMFERRALPLRQCVASAATESRALAALRDTLLPKLMSGQITVRQAEKTIEETL